MMKYRLFAATAITAVLLAGCGTDNPEYPPASTALTAGTGALSATIHGVVVGKGTLWCALHTGPQQFPGASPIVGGTRTQAAAADPLRCEFDKLPAGTYAISVYQDEDDNGELDTNVFGAPTEGYGASRNALPATSAPTFEENSVSLSDGQHLAVDITLRN
ncbi:MAG: DUF2141 domain-containing protein [Polyangiaceae bacterium]